MSKHLVGDLAVIATALVGAAVLGPLVSDSVLRLFVYVAITVAAAVTIGVRADRQGRHERRRAKNARGSRGSAA